MQAASPSPPRPARRRAEARRVRTTIANGETPSAAALDLRPWPTLPVVERQSVLLKASPLGCQPRRSSTVRLQSAPSHRKARLDASRARWALCMLKVPVRVTLDDERMGATAHATHAPERSGFERKSEDVGIPSYGKSGTVLDKDFSGARSCDSVFRSREVRRRTWRRSPPLQLW